MFLFRDDLFYLQSTLSYIKRTSSLEAYIEWFNRLGYLVATEVCLVSRETDCMYHIRYMAFLINHELLFTVL